MVITYASRGMQESSPRLRDRIAAAYGRAGGVAALNRRERRWLMAVLLAGIGLRVWWVIYAVRPARGVHDPAFYTLLGRSIADGHGYRLLSGEPTAFYPVGYSAALSVVFRIMSWLPFGDNEPLAVGLFNLLLGVATILLVFELGRRLFDNRIAIVAAAIVGLYPNLIFHTSAALTETLFNFIMILALVVLVWRPWTGRFGWRVLVPFGVLLGASALVRPISLLVLPALAVVWLLAGYGWRPTVRWAAVIAVATVAVIAPWSVRNMIVMDSPRVLISTNLGDNLCIGNNANATGAFNVGLDATARTDAYCFHDLGDMKRPAYEVRRNTLTLNRALDYIRAHPGHEVTLSFKKLWYTIYNDHDGLFAVESYGQDAFIPHTLRNTLETLANVWFWSTSIIGVLGIARLTSRREPRRRFVLAAMVALALPIVIFFGDPRFKLPVVPLLSIAAAGAIVAAWERLRRPARADPEHETAAVGAVATR
jgi:4-amino-4-deoxy-L-arabinose transferase-like glycosyltransferase